MPGGRHAYIPALKVCPLPRSTSSPSRIHTSSQKSWAIVSVVSTPAAKWSSRVTSPVAGSRPRIFCPPAGGEGGHPRHVAGGGIAAQDLLPHAGATSPGGGGAGDGFPGQVVGPEELAFGLGHGR